MTYPLRVQIEFTAHAWRDVQITNNEFKGTLFWGDVFSQCRRPVEENPRFWYEVKNLFFRLQDGDERAVKAFYEEYGPLLSFAEREKRESVYRRLEWFVVLTNLVRYIREGRMGPLEDMVPLNQVFDAPTRLHFYGDSPRGGIFAMARAVVKQSNPPVNFVVGPRSDAELRSMAWEAVLRAVTEYINTESPGSFTIQPLWGSSPGQPLDTWTVFTLSAFPAAFFQWYFQELVPMASGKCAAEGCFNPVPDDRRKHTAAGRRAFCSAKCRERQKKRDQRQRLAEKDLTV